MTFLFRLMSLGRMASFLLVLSFVLSGCLKPKRSFSKTRCPKAPDYASSSNWTALPDKKDSADAIPKNSGLVDGQKDAKVDVFFVHPTTYIFGRHWNASVKYKKLNKKTDKTTILHQASIFNGDCKVYAPRYRQAILGAYWDKKGNAPMAFDTAYADVKRAFKYYLKNFNKGRPFIIASHSQGTDHAVRLVKEFFLNDSVLRSQLVACYLVGRPIGINSIKVITPCESPEQTGCFVTWNTIAWGEEKWYGVSFDTIHCVNPLSWKSDTAYVSAKMNKGTARYNLVTLDKELIDAKVNKGLLWVHMPKGNDYPGGKVLHVYDYNLFYVNIRENIKQRIDTYFKLHPEKLK